MAKSWEVLNSNGLTPVFSLLFFLDRFFFFDEHLVFFLLLRDLDNHNDNDHNDDDQKQCTAHNDQDQFPQSCKKKKECKMEEPKPKQSSANPACIAWIAADRIQGRRSLFHSGVHKAHHHKSCTYGQYASWCDSVHRILPHTPTRATRRSIRSAHSRSRIPLKNSLNLD